MFSLRSVLGRAIFAKRKPSFCFESPPSVKLVKAHFRREGWHVAYCSTVGFSFLAIKDSEQKRLAVGLCYSGIADKDLSLVPELNQQQKATCVIIVDEVVPEHKSVEAVERLVVMIHWRELATLERAIADLRRRSRDGYLAAKSRLQEELDRDNAPEFRSSRNARHGAEIVFQSDYTECVIVDRGSKDTLVTFGGISDKAGDGRYLGYSVSERLRWNLVCLRTFSPSWYPAHDAAKWLPILQEALRSFKGTTIAVGADQGGYGVLRFARRLNCNIAIAISPTATIDPWDIEDRRFNRYFAEELHHSMALKPEELPDRPVLIYDPEDELDKKQVGLISLRNGSIDCFLRFAGPATTWLLTSEDVLYTTLVACRDQDWIGLRALCALSRKRNVERAFTMAFALCERRPSVAVRLFEKYGQHADVRRWSSVCFRLAKVGMGSRVLPAMEKALVDFPDDVPLSVSASLVALELGQASKALSLIEKPLLSDGQNLTYNWIRQTAKALLLKGL